MGPCTCHCCCLFCLLPRAPVCVPPGINYSVCCTAIDTPLDADRLLCRRVSIAVRQGINCCAMLSGRRRPTGADGGVRPEMGIHSVFTPVKRDPGCSFGMDLGWG